VLVRSPHHHARFKVLDTAEVAGQPGVLAVLTARDVPGSPTFGALVQDQPVLAVDVVRHVGEPVALVVAEDRDAALRAAQSIQVSYDPLEAVFDPIRALQADAPLVHPGGNLLTSYDVGCGDLEAGFKLADRILEDDFSVQRVSPAYMEPETSLSRWNPDGTLTTWVSSQKPHEDRRSIAAVLSLPLERVQVLSTVIGGAFGGKEDSSIAILASLGAWATHRTVRLVNARPESFVAHPKRHPAFVHLKVGAKLDGTLTALHVAAYLDTGAYASYGPAVGGLFTEVATGPYRIPHTRVQTQVVYTNSPYSGAMRGFGSPQAHFPVESCLDMLAAQLGMDPLDLRRKNILLPGDSLPTRVVVDAGAGALGQCLDIAQEARERLRAIPAAPGRKAGVGLALALQSMGLGAQVPDVSTHRLEWLPDGRVLIYLGAPDLGQGLATVAEAIVAEALELSFDQVITAPFDTLTTPDGGVTCGSRMTYLVGNALLTGAGKLKQKLLESAAAQLDVSPDALAYQRGAVFLPDGACHPAGEFARRAWEAGSCLQAEGSAAFPYPEATTPQHLPVGMPHVKFVYAGQVARVEVDPELGTVDVTHVVAIHDVGRIIHRTALEGQIEGGIAMGIGYALLEDVALKPGAGWVDSFTEYLLPTSRDVAPELELHILEIPDPQGPYGAKGVAEICLVPTAPAIANAVQDAVDARIKHLPVTPEKILSLSRSSR
jgi:CO/xanthine dehydrogenase Mo-binding subunit